MRRLVRMSPRVLLATALAVGFAFPATTFAQRDRTRTDLTVSDLTAPASAVAGSSLRFRAEISNAGNATTTFRWAAYLTIGGAVSTGRLLATFGPVSLDGGQSMIVDETVALPADASGRQRLAIVVDHDNQVGEVNEYDNTAIAIDFTRIRPRAADLRIASVSMRATERRANEAVDIDYVVVNDGELEATFVVSAHLSKNGAATPSDPELGRDTITLAPGERLASRLAGTIPASLQSGDYQVGVIADPEQTVAESLELNNLGVSANRLNVFSDELLLVNESVPSGAVFLGYHTLFTAAGGNGHYVYTVSQGNLPNGLRLQPTGTLSGTALQSGSFEFDVTVGSNGLRATRTLSMRIHESGIDLTITTPTLGKGTVSLPFQAGLAAAGGEPPYSWSLTDGVLPPGLDLNGSGWMSGIPRTQGHFTFSVEVRDGAGSRDFAEFEISVDAANVVILSGRLNPIPLGDQADIELRASGGKLPYTWKAKSPLPPGMSLTEDGHLVGSPTTVGEFAVRVQVIDASEAGADDTSLLHLVVEEAGVFEIKGEAIPRLLIREPLEYVLETDGGVAPMSWRLVPGDSLPDGFTIEVLNDRQAVIRGSTYRRVAHGFAVRVDDAAGRRREVVLGIEVFRPLVPTSSCACATPKSDAPIGLALMLVIGGLVVARRRR